MEMIPFAPMPLPLMRKISEPFEGFGYRVSKMFPGLEHDLMTSGIRIAVEEYGAVMSFSLIFYFIIFGALLTLILSKFITTSSSIGSLVIPHYIILGILVGFVMGLLVFFQMLAYPTIKTKKRIREIERNLVFALRTMLVQLRSRVSLFDSMYMIASSRRYGQLSIEMKEAVDNISTGVSEEVALQELAVKNPSPYLRKVLWQIVNGMRAGSDITDVLGESVSSITREQQISIENYGNSLKILSLVY
ncbi:MAG: type II secretion system F family protein, partial [Candidatus Diapherotrites archaeon]|nr:type II secretion system F family protein [Candidatus Diapherotrites archaeon]